MEKFIINGNYPLKGDVKISGAKNAALPIIAASLLTKETVTLKQIPRVSDVFTMLKVLQTIGCNTKLEGKTLSIDAILLCVRSSPG
jgi:UDP-N-acetylglucosamine 1-carboxyvinyltransferase